MKETGARANEDGILQCKAAIGSDVTLGIFDQCIQPATMLRLFYIYIYRRNPAPHGRRNPPARMIHVFASSER